MYAVPFGDDYKKLVAAVTACRRGDLSQFEVVRAYTDKYGVDPLCQNPILCLTEAELVEWQNRAEATKKRAI